MLLGLGGAFELRAIVEALSVVELAAIARPHLPFSIWPLQISCALGSWDS